jgi:hypothetical protein
MDSTKYIIYLALEIPLDTLSVRDRECASITLDATGSQQWLLKCERV